MTPRERYREFLIDYEQNLERFKNDANQCGDESIKTLTKIFKKIAHKIYPLTYKEWLSQELEYASKIENFKYAKEIKEEIDKL